MRTRIVGARVVTPGGVREGDLVLDDVTGRIVSVGGGEPALPDEAVVMAQGAWAVPGGVDPHVSLHRGTGALRYGPNWAYRTPTNGRARVPAGRRASGPYRSRTFRAHRTPTSPGALVPAGGASEPRSATILLAVPDPDVSFGFGTRRWEGYRSPMGDRGGCLFVPGDQPLVSVASLRAMGEEFSRYPGSVVRLAWHELGRVYYEGSPIPNTGVPGDIGGHSVERVLRAPADGLFEPVLRIGDVVRAGDVAAVVAGVPLRCAIDGVLRGLLQEGVLVTPGMSVEQNVVCGATGATSADRSERAAAQIRAMHLEGLERRRPSELSGGQQQRCAMDDKTYEAWVVTVSDRCAADEREDASGPALTRLLAGAGYRVTRAFVVPDEQPQIADALRHAVGADVALVVTTGGTGFSPRDVTPEATMEVCERMAPGIPETMRAASMNFATRSFTEPPGLVASYLPRMVALPLARAVRSTRGVDPMSFSVLSANFMYRCGGGNRSVDDIRRRFAGCLW